MRDSAERPPLRLLFVCDQNRLRSPTAEAMYAHRRGVEARSAGLDSDAVIPITGDLVRWADVVFVMQREQRSRLRKLCLALSPDIRVLDILDVYARNDPELRALIRRGVEPVLVAHGLPLVRPDPGAWAAPV